MAKAKERLFIYCFQRLGKIEPPFLAELLETGKRIYMIKVGRNEYAVDRAACSTTPYTQADLDEFQPHEQPGLKIEAHPGVVIARKPSGNGGMFG